MKRAELNGHAATILARLQPDLKYRVVGSFLEMSQLRRRAKLFILALCGQINTSSYWQILHDYHYVKGMKNKR